MIELNATFFAQILNFLILVAILRAVAYKPVVRMLKEREDKIAESIQKADADAAAAEATLNEYKNQLKDAHAKAQEIVDKAEKRAREEHEASIQATKQEIEQMRKAAQEEIQRDRERAVEQLKDEFGALAMAAAGKIIAKNMDAKENEAIIGEFIDQLDSKKIGDLSC
ncbi:MAG: F0F1 ATP synthase subunit B [Selenomonadaceae bacterium]|nr:F0F1 ATP synthase subunit B [Selenomonadaceae bacterium]MBR0285136.1 F0F1 ATP synthase subunit B [Selenomonadaceae bacterium]MBR6343309.1 F0F1 ATP synthase subunit B [Selenomonadaceae bacterium]MBR6710220.1 F0F1 ATP synthase subunit B [Selenomonadaceae bacterium]MBR6906381.1 F0F1 ATP synthase subunit B [Selenomonadaceae bacterium]